MRVFGTFSNETVLSCKFFSGHLPVEHMIRQRKINFIRSLSVSNNQILQQIYNSAGISELKSIADFYQVTSDALLVAAKSIIYQCISSRVPA